MFQRVFCPKRDFFHSRNLCLSLREGCSIKDLLLLWRHECDWVYNRRLVDSVDRERYQQTFVNAVKKEFSSPEQVCYEMSGQAESLVRDGIKYTFPIITSGIRRLGALQQQ